MALDTAGLPLPRASRLGLALPCALGLAAWVLLCAVCVGLGLACWSAAGVVGVVVVGPRVVRVVGALWLEKKK